MKTEKCCGLDMLRDPSVAAILGPEFFSRLTVYHFKCSKCGAGRHVVSEDDREKMKAARCQPKCGADNYCPHMERNVVDRPYEVAPPEPDHVIIAKRRKRRR